MDATRLYLADCVGVIVLPISRIIIASTYKELRYYINYSVVTVAGIWDLTSKL